MIPKHNRVKRNGQRGGTFVKPSDLKASELRAVVALHNNGGRAVVSAGHAFTSKLIIRFKTFCRLIEFGLAYRANGDLELTNAGNGIGRSFKDRPILGYD